MTRDKQLELLAEVGGHLVAALYALQKLVTGEFREEAEQAISDVIQATGPKFNA